MRRFLMSMCDRFLLGHMFFGSMLYKGWALVGTEEARLCM